MIDAKAINLAEEIKNLEKLKGQERGQDIIFLVAYAKRMRGEEGVELIARELKRYGYSMPDINKISAMEWIPASLPTIYMVAMAKLFNWGEEEICDMGENAVKLSSTMKIFIKYFISPRRTFAIAAKNWRKHYSFGELEVVEYNPVEKKLILHLKNFKKHKITCIYLSGTFAGIASLALDSNNVRGQETKCMFKGDPYHEFVITWK